MYKSKRPPVNLVGTVLHTFLLDCAHASCEGHQIEATDADLHLVVGCQLKPTDNTATWTQHSTNATIWKPCLSAGCGAVLCFAGLINRDCEGRGFTQPL